LAWFSTKEEEGEGEGEEGRMETALEMSMQAFQRR
jgi:hypothetical protein